MITKEALDKLEQWILTATPINGAHEAIVLPREMSVHDLDSFRATKRRVVATYNTGSIADFCAYLHAAEGELKAQGLSTPMVFVAMDYLAATAILDFGSIKKPGHCRHHAVLELSPTPEWQAVQCLDGQKMKQNDFLDWCMDWRDPIGFVDASKQTLDCTVAIGALRKITLSRLNTGESEVQRLATTQTAMEKIEAKSDGLTPAYLHFMGRPAEGLPKRVAVIRIDLVPNEDKTGILIKTRWMERESQRQSIQQEFMDFLKRELGDSAAVYFGSMVV